MADGEHALVGDLLVDLIRIPSVNPEGDPGTGLENCGEGKVAEFVGNYLQDLGAEVRYDEVEPDRPNVIGAFPGGGGKPAVLLGPHLDTVGVGGMSVAPFGAERRNGKIFGRGACDTKGTMAAMLWALKEIGAEGIAGLDIGVTFAGFMGEETGQPGSRDFARRYRGEYDFALVGEPTGCDIVHKHKGTLGLQISAKGKAAHGSTPERGESAIVKMAPLLLALEGEFREFLSSGEFEDDLLGHPTVNVGQIRGGTRTNIVAETCDIRVDLRVTPKLAAAGALEATRTFLDGRGFGEFEIGTSLRCEPLDTRDDNPFVQRLAAQPGAPQLVGAPWFCDAAVLANEGDIPGVAAGPGDIAQAHTADEWIDEAELERGAVFYRDFLFGVKGVSEFRPVSISD